MSTPSKNWNELLQLLNPEHPIAEKSKTQEAVRFWREWDQVKKRAVWCKQYLKTGQLDLLAFNRAEAGFLSRLTDYRVNNVYQSTYIVQSGTRLDQFEIRTIDCGPTIEDWLRTPVRLKGGQKPQAHCFVQPEAYLRLALGVLNALHNIHSAQIVHCDLHSGNVCLPSQAGPHGSQAVHPIRLDWERLALIDFGYAIHLRHTPETMLPLLYEGQGVRISPLLQSILAQIAGAADKVIQQTGEIWSAVMFNPAWWLRKGGSILEAFGALDWREDIFQLGRMLKDIRDGTGEAEFLGGRTVRDSKSGAVNRLVEELPEELIGLGSSEERGESPNRPLAHRITEALSDANAQGVPYSHEFELHQADFELGESMATPFAPAAPVAPAARHVSKETPLVRPPEPQKAKEPPVRHPPPPVAGRPRVQPVSNFPLPAMKPLRTAAPAGWRFAVAGTPVTLRQWQAAYNHNAGLFRPGLLTQSGGVAVESLDLPVTGVSYQDCLAFIDTLNDLSGAVANDPLAHYRLPTPEEWALLRAGSVENARPPPGADIATIPVTQWKPDARGIAGVRNYLWQWVNASLPAGWAQARGGCQAQFMGGSIQNDRDVDADGDPVDQYPTDWRSPFITLRLVRFEPGN